MCRSACFSIHASTGFDTLDPRRATAFERDSTRAFLTLFCDLIYDSNRLHRSRTSFSTTAWDQHKASDQPFAQEQSVYVLEDRLTLTRRLNRLPSAIRARVARGGQLPPDRGRTGPFSMRAISARITTDAMAAEFNDATRA